MSERKRRQLYLMKTNVPSGLGPYKTANWEWPDIQAKNQHITVKDEMWWADYSREKLVKIRENFRKKNPKPNPPVRFTIRKVDKIPDGYT